MIDQIVTADIAQQLHNEAIRTRAMAAWIVMETHHPHPGKMLARLATTEPTVYVLLADTLAELRAQIPPGLERSGRTPADPEGVVEIWFS